MNAHLAKRILRGTAALLLLIAALFMLGPVLARFDSDRDAQGKPPLFCWNRWIGRPRAMADGGSQSYQGFGYHFLSKRRIIFEEGETGPRFGTETGVVVEFQLPWFKRFNFDTTRRHYKTPSPDHG